MPRSLPTFSAYALEANRTRLRPPGAKEKLGEGTPLTLRERMLGFACGLAGEAGEVADLVKKWAIHGHELDAVKLTKELGDVLWYMYALAAEQGIILQAVAEANIDKLQKRYPEGFSHAASINRVDEDKTPAIVLQCHRCLGCGEISSGEGGEPWTAWKELPAESNLAVRLGLVKPIACPYCKGTGKAP